ncbi:hypothetical protein QR680_018797 [Steinernema hermaphroditum]|uniref:GH18 domain-containing protein n=1 Tax=Steinernema hermaphroditum TaxID=289476 RepID=A0AA39LRM3_9BILA|nr:hypothetical protein QR680_018797 [Steinernema hermaphroditum]
MNPVNGSNENASSSLHKKWKVDKRFESGSVASPISAKDYLRPCYFTDWSVYREGDFKFAPEDYLPGLCTHIVFGFGWINFHSFAAAPMNPSDLGDNGTYARVNKLKQSDPGLKTILSFGGAYFPVEVFRRLASGRHNRQKFIGSAVEWVEKHGFDGIAIDWKFPEAEDKTNFVSLVKELKEAVKKARKEQLLVSVSLSADISVSEAGYDLAELGKQVDFALLLAYNFHGTWNQTGLNAPLCAKKGDPKSVEFSAFHVAKSGFPRKKIIIGVDAQGRGWTLADPSKREVGAPASGRTKSRGAYYEICHLLKQGAKRHWDDLSKTPYLVKGNQWFSYDDEQSIGAKIDFVIEHGFGGAFTWSLDFDDFKGKCNGKKYPLLSVIAKKLK